MAWTIELLPAAIRELEKFDRLTQRRLLRFLRERVAASADPRALGEALQGPLRRFWKYRVGDYRIICEIADRRLVVLVVRLAHRSKVYR